MFSKEINQVKSRSIFSALSLVGQSSYSAILGFATFFILTIKSSVYILGIYNTVLATISFFNYFTNLGIAAALIHKKRIDEIDLNSAFFFQLFLVSIAVILGYLFTEKIFVGYRNLPPNTVYLYWAILISFFLLSLKTIPSVLLEKELEIYKVVIVQSLENSVFYLTIVVLVFLGFDIMAITAAVLIRAIFGVVSIYLIRRWRPRLMFSFATLKGLLSYGIPFQGNSFLALIKDDLIILYLSRSLGFEKLGYITFAKKYAEASLRLIADNINRVAFPLLAKFQSNKPMLRKSLEKVIFYSSFLVLPFIIGGIFIFDTLLKIVPGYYDKWHMALLSFFFFSLSALLVSLTSPFINFFNAVGRVRLSLVFMSLWTAMMWIMIPVSIKILDFNGVAVVFFIISLTFIFVIQRVKEIVDFSLVKVLRSIIWSLLFLIIYLVVVRLISLGVLKNRQIHLVFSLFGGPLVYFLSLFLIQGRAFIDDLFKTVLFKGK